MKRRTFLALGLTAALSIPFAMTAFADGSQYKPGQTVEFSGHTDFGYYYTYTAGSSQKVNFKCFSVVNNDVRTYAAVHEDLYDYYKLAFEDKDVVFKGDYQFSAGDGAPIVIPTWEVRNEEEDNKLYRLENYIAPLLYQEGTAPNFKLFGELYGTGATVSAADDGSYLTIDTNPLNIKGSFVFKEDSLAKIKLTNASLGLPEWLYGEMMDTRAIDGKQRESFDHVTVSWSYSPNQGLEVMYRTNT